MKRWDLQSVTFNLVIGLLAFVALVLMVMPTLVVLVTSFTAGYSLRFPPQGYSLRWYAALIDAWQLQFAALNSLKVALWSTGISVLLGTMAALGIARSNRLSAQVLDSVFMAPMILPGLAFGLAALIFFAQLALPVSQWTLVTGHTVICVPFVIRVTVAALRQLDPALLESSASLGATRLYALRRITLPLIGSAMLVGAFLAFMSSFDNIPVSLFLRSASTDMLPIRMWQDLESLLDVRIAAASSVIILFSITAFVVMQRFASLSKHLGKF